MASEANAICSRLVCRSVASKSRGSNLNDALVKPHLENYAQVWPPHVKEARDKGQRMVTGYIRPH